MIETLFDSFDEAQSDEVSLGFNKSLGKEELSQLENDLRQVARSRDDARTVCTVDVIRTATKPDARRRSSVRKLLEWEEDLRQIKKSLYSSANISRLIPLYGLTRDLSPHVAIVHLKSLYLPFLRVVELQRRLYKAECEAVATSLFHTHPHLPNDLVSSGLPLYISLLPCSCNVAVIVKVPLYLEKPSTVCEFATIAKKPRAATFHFSSAIRIPIPVLVHQHTGRVGFFDTAIEVTLNNKSFFTFQATLEGALVRAGTSPLKQPMSICSIARQSQGRQLQQVDLSDEGRLSLVVTDIIHASQKTSHNMTLGSIKGRLKEIFQKTTSHTHHSKCVKERHTPLMSFLSNGSGLQLRHSEGGWKTCNNADIAKAFKVTNQVLIRSAVERCTLSG
eukprot:Blabericola_migrator_1__4143@NODE_2266_length_3035_cov_12_053235_g1426_i0_p2_GENE_NODE_2266_length_3035_cov_12_053235_g1426_i0NODE_2266_length_3035_cov_12_053235_g1426_i0_p2_ORF_typecomplete_len391_score60_05_NODE_2266_length_3035_cov_12_053235_g1426_i014412613